MNETHFIECVKITNCTTNIDNVEYKIKDFNVEKHFFTDDHHLSYNKVYSDSGFGFINFAQKDAYELFINVASYGLDSFYLADENSDSGILTNRPSFLIITTSEKLPLQLFEAYWAWILRYAMAYYVRTIDENILNIKIPKLSSFSYGGVLFALKIPFLKTTHLTRWLFECCKDEDIQRRCYLSIMDNEDGLEENQPYSNNLYIETSIENGDENKIIEYLYRLEDNERSTTTNVYLLKVSEKREFCYEKMATCDKKIDTIYLKKNDKHILKTKLDNYLFHRDKMEELGLPVKLGILLYGVGGTGKSSCISVISTYLKKDIYYVNLNLIESNDELKTVFNHVVRKNGIICFEDIDTMTDLVYERSNSGSKEIDKKFTLDFMLNIR